jgi:hypothetical protein
MVAAQPIPLSKILPESVITAQLLTIFGAFYKTEGFITFFCKSWQSVHVPIQMNPIHSLPQDLFYIHFSSYLYISVPNVPLSTYYPTKYYIYFPPLTWLLGVKVWKCIYKKLIHISVDSILTFLERSHF